MKKIHEHMVSFFESKVLVGILYGVGIIIVVASVFSAGISIGFHKASFGRAWGENYERNFGMMSRQGLVPGGQHFPNANGAVGKIIKITLPTVIVQDRDNTEKVILIGSDTRIQEMHSTIKATDLSVGDFIVVIGSPNDQGQVAAKFIRVMPAGMPTLGFQIPPATPAIPQ